MLTLLPFLPILMLVVVANLGQTYAWARWLTYLGLVVLTGFVFVGGVAMLILPSDVTNDLLPPGLNPDWRAAGWWFLATSIVTGLVVGAGALAALMGRDPRIRGLHWARPVQLTALFLGLIYTGLNLGQSALIPDPNALTALGVEFGPGELAPQAAAFVALAILGVGLGLRRPWAETLQRLKLHRPSLGDLFFAAGATLVMVIASGGLGYVLSLISPTSAASSDAFNQILVGGFSSIGGAVLLGLLSGISEEILYRGAVQPAFGLWPTSLLFALHHIQYLNLTIILIVLLGLTLGWIRNRTSTTTAALVHAAYNTILVLMAMFAGQITGQ